MNDREKLLKIIIFLILTNIVTLIFTKSYFVLYIEKQPNDSHVRPVSRVVYRNETPFRRYCVRRTDQLDRKVK